MLFVEKGIVLLADAEPLFHRQIHCGSGGGKRLQLRLGNADLFAERGESPFSLQYPAERTRLQKRICGACVRIVVVIDNAGVFVGARHAFYAEEAVLHVPDVEIQPRGFNKNLADPRKIALVPRCVPVLAERMRNIRVDMVLRRTGRIVGRALRARNRTPGIERPALVPEHSRVRARRVEVLVTVIQQLFRHFGRARKEKRKRVDFAVPKVMPLVPLAAQSFGGNAAAAVLPRRAQEFVNAEIQIRLCACVPAYLDAGTAPKCREKVLLFFNPIVVAFLRRLPRKRDRSREQIALLLLIRICAILRQRYGFPGTDGARKTRREQIAVPEKLRLGAVHGMHRSAAQSAFAHQRFSAQRKAPVFSIAGCGHEFLFGTGRNARVVRVAEVGHIAVEQRVQPQFARIINGRNSYPKHKKIFLNKAHKSLGGNNQCSMRGVLPVFPRCNARGKVQPPRHFPCRIIPGGGRFAARPNFYALRVRQVDQYLLAVWKSIQPFAIADFLLLVETVDIRPADGAYAAPYAFFQTAPNAEVAVCAVEQCFVARQRFVAVPFCCKLQFVQTRILLDQAGTQSGKDIFFKSSNPALCAIRAKLFFHRAGDHAGYNLLLEQQYDNQRRYDDDHRCRRYFAPED